MIRLSPGDSFLANLHSIQSEIVRTVIDRARWPIHLQTHAVWLISWMKYLE